MTWELKGNMIYKDGLAVATVSLGQDGCLDRAAQIVEACNARDSRKRIADTVDALMGAVAGIGSHQGLTLDDLDAVVDLTISRLLDYKRDIHVRREIVPDEPQGRPAREYPTLS